MAYELQYATPESVGVPSRSISKFLTLLEERGICAHSFAMAKNGRVIYEGYYPPFNDSFRHRMYSTSKTFVSMAIGLLCDAGKIKLSDPIVKYFPEYVPENPHRWLTEMTIRDMLMMATCHNGTTYSLEADNWIKTFFTSKPNHPAGSVFYYDTSATTTLNGLVEKISGENIIDFLRPRLFDPLGMSEGITSIERPEGGAWGGSGFLMTTTDLLRFAMFLTNKGCWNGRQLISREYMEAATSKQIDNQVSNTEPEQMFGYGYQIWRLRNNSYATLGMGTQIAVCMPDRQMCYVVTADTQHVSGGTSDVIATFWDTIYAATSDAQIAEDKPAQEALAEQTKNLKMLPVKGSTESPMSDTFNGKTYRLEPNQMGMTKVRFTFDGDKGCMYYTNRVGDIKIDFGIGHYEIGTFGHTDYFGHRIGVPSGKGYRCAANAVWTDDRSLTMFCYLIDDYFGTLKIDVHFGDGEICLLSTKTAEWFLNDYYGFAAGPEIKDGEE